MVADTNVIRAVKTTLATYCAKPIGPSGELTIIMTSANSDAPLMILLVDSDILFSSLTPPTSQPSER
jgi:hypothetical protein